MEIRFTLNSIEQSIEITKSQTLFDYLRNSGIKSVKYGCDDGRCGACAVLIDNKAFNSCLILMHTLNGKTVETIENFAKNRELHPLQKQFIDEGAIQCGYCTPGMLISLEALNRENQNPNEDEIKDALAGNLCRCTGYVKPILAAKSTKEHENE